jgi:hypothetical protein
MADGNLSMGQVSYNNATKGQQNLAPTLLMGGGVIDDGAVKVQQTSTGEQILTEHVDNLQTTLNGSSAYIKSAHESLTGAKSTMASLTLRGTSIASVVDTQTKDLAHGFVSGSAASNLVSVADTEALKAAFNINDTTNNGNSVADNQGTGTDSHLGGKSPIPLIDAGFKTTASNNHEIRTDMSEQETQAYNTAMEHVKMASITDSLTSNNSEDMRLSDNLNVSLSQQEQIAEEKAKTQQDIDTYSNQISYLDQYLQKIMETHPELGSKDQALRWTKTHQAEADAIAHDTIKQNNPLKTPEFKAKVQDIQQNTPTVENTKIATPDSLKRKHLENAAKVDEQAVVKDTTNGKKSIKEVVNNAVNNSNLGYNKSTEAILKENLNSDEKIIAQNLDNEKKKGEGSKSGEVAAAVKEAKEEAKSTTGQSTMLRVFEKVGNDTSDVLGIEKVNSKRGGKK